MSENEKSTTTGWYKHDTAENCQLFHMKIKTKVMQHKDETVRNNMKKLMKKDAIAKSEEKIAADEHLFGYITEQIADASLAQTLMTRYDDRGGEAFHYIMGSMAINNDTDKVNEIEDEYYAITESGFPIDASPADVRKAFTAMATKRALLADTLHPISEQRLSCDMIRLVRRMSEGHALDVHLKCSDLTKEQLETPTSVATMLETIVSKRHTASAKSDNALAVMLADKGVTVAELDVLLAKHRAQSRAEQCKHCKAHHNGACMAKMITEGKVPSNWDKKPIGLRQTVAKRAEEMVPGCTKKLELGVLVCDLPDVLVASTPKSRGTFTLELDSKAAPTSKYHFIRDKSLFANIGRLAEPVMVSIGGGRPLVEHVGAIAIMHPATGQRTIINNCLYSESFPGNILNITELRRRGAVWHVDASADMRDTLDVHGTSYAVSAAQSIEVLPSEASPRTDLCVMNVEAVQRGAHGRLHIDANAMDGAERAAFDLQYARLNDPGLARLRSLPLIADGVAPVLAKANEVNTASLTRFLADPPQSAPRQGTTPRADKPGAKTQMDIWKGPCTSLRGNNYMLGAVDSHSSNIKLFPMKAKSQSPAAADAYFTRAKAAGVDIDHGGVTYTDNEIVLNSVKFNAVTSSHNQARRNSVEYTPTGNSDAENTFRIVPHEMRKSMIRAGVPDEFWDDAALDAQDLMESTRVRDGVAAGERFDGHRRSLSRRRVWGCRVVAKKLPTWIASKTDDRGVVGINLGKSHSKPGWNVWSPDFGFFTSKHVTFYETVFPFKDGTFKLVGGSTGGGGGVAAPIVAAPTAEDDDDEDDDGSQADSGPGAGVVGGSSDSASDGRSGSGGLSDYGSDDGSSGDDGDAGDVPLVPGNPNMVAHHRSSSPSYDHSSGLLDDMDSKSGTEAEVDQPHEAATGLYALVVEAFDSIEQVALAEAAAPRLDVMMSSLKKAKMEREQRESGIPPPWRGLQAASEEVRSLMMPAEMKEIDGILDTKSAYEVLLDELPPGTPVYETLTIRNIKKNGPNKGKPKVRVVVKRGPSDVESHSPTIQMSTLRCMLALAAARRAKLKGGDFPQAYLNAEQEVYHVYPPKSARQYDEHGRRIVWALPKALYGGRGSGRHWYFTLRAWLIANGFVVSEWDPCLFVKTTPDGHYHYIGVYVDDLIHVYSDESAYQAVVDKFAKEFHGYTDLGPLNEIFNAEVSANEQFVTLTQSRYVDLLASKFLDEAAKESKVHTPAEPDLLKWATDAANDECLSPDDHVTYREIVGAALYVATVSRPDIAVAVGLLSRALEHPSSKCLAAAKRVVHYLYCTREIGLRWTVGDGDLTLSGMSDADWAVVKSTSGYVFMLARAAVAYVSKKQVSIAMSSTEAEIMAASLAALEAVFLRGILKEMQALQADPTVIGVDNQGAIALSKNYLSNSRTKHIERRHLKVRELVAELQVKTEFLPTDDNPADMMTKPLGRAKFEKFRRFVLNHGG